MQQSEPDQASVLSAGPDGQPSPSGPAGPDGRDGPGPGGVTRGGLVAEGLTKAFGPTTALREVSATFARGRVHGLIGENGSGKSTFVKVVAGIHRADLGRVTFGGVTVAAGDAAAPGAVRIGTVYQDGSLIEELTVGQNLDLIVEPPFRRDEARRAETGNWRRGLLDRFGLPDIDLASPVATLPASEQRLVEIAATLARRPDVLLFDESTSVLDERGVARVLGSMRDAAAQGACVIFVTHRLHEVLAVAQDIIVLRDGAVVAELPTAGASTDELVRHMAGREVAAFQRREVSHAGEHTILQARGLRAARCGPVNLAVRRGEIVGIAGAAGNGQAELIRALAGEGRRSGEVRVGGGPVTHRGGGVAGGGLRQLRPPQRVPVQPAVGSGRATPLRCAAAAGPGGPGCAGVPRPGRPPPWPTATTWPASQSSSRSARCPAVTSRRWRSAGR